MQKLLHKLAAKVNQSVVNAKDANLVYLAIFVAASAIVAYMTRFAGRPLGDPDSWGQFGDFIGGIVNPVVGLVTVILVVRTLNVTRSEARNTRNEMEAQTRSLEKQFELSARESYAADVRRKLEGILNTWNSHIERQEVNGAIGIDAHGQPVKVNCPLSTVFENFIYHHYIEDTFRRKDKTCEYLTAMFIRAVHLLEEFENALLEYSDVVENKNLTDYYRRRVVRASRLLTEIGLLSEEAAAGLAIDTIRAARQKRSGSKADQPAEILD
ncbi:hypothetical protein ACFJIW_12090 [Tahibacter sp. UC22_41]|uniref:hypothetical protein n=1 Tax=Tahibacter sp. UC22_41 TaxID=3350178 RepID=UPI0036DD8AF7